MPDRRESACDNVVKFPKPFGSEARCDKPVSDLEERLRQSERKKRQLERRIEALLSRD